MSKMDWNNFFIALISGSFAGSILAFFFNRKNTRADTFMKLATTVSSLSDDLESERMARRKDNAWFESELQRLKNDYQEKIDLLEKRVKILENENHELRIENHTLKQQLNK